MRRDPEILITDRLAWAVGLYEGEGSASIGRNGTPVVCMGMTNPEAIYEFHKVVGVGKVYEFNSKPPRKKVYSWRTTRRDDIIYVLTLFLNTNLLSAARIIQARRVLERAQEINPSLRGMHANKKKADIELLKKVGLIR